MTIGELRPGPRSFSGNFFDVLGVRAG